MIGLCCPDVHNVTVLFSGFPDVHGQENELWRRQGPVSATLGIWRGHNAVVV